MVNKVLKKSSNQKALNLIDRLAGSVEIPSRCKRFSLEKIVDKAKKEYYAKK